MDEAASKVHIGSMEQPKQLEEIKRTMQQRSEEMEEAILQGNLTLAGSIRSERQELKQAYGSALTRYKRSLNRKKAGSQGENEVADVVADWTHIPVKRLTEGEARASSASGKITAQTCHCTGRGNSGSCKSGASWKSRS